MGADYYQTEAQREEDIRNGIPPPGIGENSIIKRAIIDKIARIGRNVRIVNAGNISEVEKEKEGVWISKGITIIMKDAIIPDGKVI